MLAEPGGQGKQVGAAARAQALGSAVAGVSRDGVAEARFIGKGGTVCKQGTRPVLVRAQAVQTDARQGGAVVVGGVKRDQRGQQGAAFVAVRREFLLVKG